MNLERSNIEQIPAHAVEEIRAALQDGAELSDTTKRLFVPASAYGVAEVPENVVVRQLQPAGSTLALMVIEPNATVGVSDTRAYNEWRHAVEMARQNTGERRNGFTVHHIPKAPPEVHRLHEKYVPMIDRGRLMLDDHILLTVRLLRPQIAPQTLYVVEYDGEIGRGIATEFYTINLPRIAKALGVRFIVGNNVHTRSSEFFTDKIGRTSAVEINLAGHEAIGLEEINIFNTVQFLYPEDKERFTT